jgi:hypothetical protein
MVLKEGHCGKKIINVLQVLKCGVGKGWRSSFGQIV